MTHQQFIHLLDRLTQDRFALTALDAQSFGKFQQILLSSFQTTADKEAADKFYTQDWYLLGTDGCHLCDEVGKLLDQVHTIALLPPVHQLDLINATDDALIEALGVMIPVLITPRRLLCYPFGAMDILALAD